MKTITILSSYLGSLCPLPGRLALIIASLWLAAPAAPGADNTGKQPETSGQSLEQREREIDRQHLRKIFEALQAYRKKHDDLPGHISDLFPEFLSDPDVLMSPVEKRTGRSELWGYGDPKMKSSYIYEFSKATAGGVRDQSIPLTMKQWKTQQMEEFGPVVPILRCHLHDPVLNLSYSGDIYDTTLYWETDTNTLALQARLGIGPGAKNGKMMQVQVVDEKGKPLAGVEITATNRQSEFGPLPPRKATTDAQGRCRINLGGAKPESVTLLALKDGRASARGEWTGGAVPSEWAAKLSKAATIGGIVRDKSGRPIPNVAVSVFGIAKDEVGQSVPTQYASAATDRDGRWTCAHVPVDFDQLSFKLGHPEFRVTEYDQGEKDDIENNAVSRKTLMKRGAEMVMEPGFPVEGIVTDDQGAKLEGARLTLLTGENAETRRDVTTEKTGRFRFVLLEPCQAQLVAQAEGWAPEYQMIEVDRKIEPLTVKLGKGRVIKGRVQDGKGGFVADATVSVGNWRNLSLLSWQTQSGADGRFTWERAPADVVYLMARKAGHVPASVLIDTNQEGEATIPLQEAFGISGKVLDAETRQPIPEFKLTWGYSYGEEEDFFQWQPRAALVGSNGTYTVTLEQAYWPRIRLMAEADGYAPAATQSFPPHGKHTFDFELKQGKGLSGVVELPNGEPLDRVRVYLTENSTSVYMSEEGRIQPRVARSRNMATDAKGRFQFPPVLEPWSIIVAHDNGYAEAKASEVAETGKVVLQPWARVRGVVKVGPKPEQNQSAYLQNMLYRYGEGGRRFPALALYIEKKLEADGSFVFEKVPPGERKIVLRYKFREGSGAIPLSHSVVFSARAGETAEVTLGGTGRPVVGKVKVVEGDAGGVDWMRDVHSLTTKFAESPDNKPSEVPESASQEERMAIYKKHSAEQRAFWTSEAGHAIERRTCTYVLVFKPDGSFRAENVPAGTYQLNIVPTDPTAEQYRFAPLGSLSKEVVVPEAPASQTDEPFDLGEIELKIRK